MSSFECLVVKVVVEKHPDPEVTKIELVKIGGYVSIAPIGVFKTNDLAVYIPEASIVPENILIELNLVGRLHGSDKNRVKAIKLRGVVSQGLVLQSKEGWVEGQDVSDLLGITKYEPPIPVAMAGEVFNSGLPTKFDLENYKKFPDTFAETDTVFFTEKLHGTCTIIGFVSDKYKSSETFDEKVLIGSKGLSKQGLFFKDNERNQGNLYVRTAKKYDLINKIKQLSANPMFAKADAFYLLGETFGKGVQDLNYGFAEPEFRAFGLMIGNTLIDYVDFFELCKEFDIPTVPILYHGPFSTSELEKHTNGKDTFSNSHTREGVVVVDAAETLGFGVRMVKSISDAYLFRGGNATELT